MLNLISGDIKRMVVEKQTEKKAVKNDHDNQMLLKLTDELREMKSLVGNHINYEEINLMMDDIRESFETYINMTPRNNNEEVLTKMSALDDRMNLLQSVIDNMPRMEVIETLLPVKKSIPRLNVKK